MIEQIQIRKLTPHFGAEVIGLDLSVPMSSEDFEHIRNLFLEYQLLYFGQQQLSDSDHVRVGQQFGTLQVHVMNQYHANQHPELYRLSNVGADGKPNGQYPDKGTLAWHTDASWQSLTGQATLIYCEIAAKQGGETHFCDAYGLYDRLSPDWKERLQNKKAVHSLDFSRNRRHGHQPMTEDQRAAVPPVEHPILRTHPDTNRKSLYLGDHAEYVKDVPYEEGRQWIDELNTIGAEDELVYRHQWSDHDFLVWDNRCLLHKVMEYDAATEKRIVRRCTVIDPRPPA
jgi:taurine dioxygenase